MQYIGLIISLGVALIYAAIEYKVFESSGFKGGVIFKIVLEIIFLIISMLFDSVASNLETLLLLVPTLIGTFIGILISTAIEYYAYSKTNSFFMFIIFQILLGIFIFICLVLILFVIMCFIEPSFLLNNVILIIFLSALIIITIIVICCIIKAIRNRKIEKIIDNKIQNNTEQVKSEELDEEEDLMSFCPTCGFKLARNAKFCMRCGKHFNNN